MRGSGAFADDGRRASITVKASRMPWNELFENVLASNGLGFVLEKNLLFIARVEDLGAIERVRGRTYGGPPISLNFLYGELEDMFRLFKDITRVGDRPGRGPARLGDDADLRTPGDVGIRPRAGRERSGCDPDGRAQRGPRSHCLANPEADRCEGRGGRPVGADDQPPSHAERPTPRRRFVWVGALGKVRTLQGRGAPVRPTPWPPGPPGLRPPNTTRLGAYRWTPKPESRSSTSSSRPSVACKRRRKEEGPSAARTNVPQAEPFDQKCRPGRARSSRTPVTADQRKPVSASTAAQLAMARA